MTFGAVDMRFTRPLELLADYRGWRIEVRVSSRPAALSRARRTGTPAYPLASRGPAGGSECPVGVPSAFLLAPMRGEPSLVIVRDSQRRQSRRGSPMTTEALTYFPEELAVREQDGTTVTLLWTRA